MALQLLGFDTPLFEANCDNCWRAYHPDKGWTHYFSGPGGRERALDFAVKNNCTAIGLANFNYETEQNDYSHIQPLAGVTNA